MVLLALTADGIHNKKVKKKKITSTKNKKIKTLKKIIY
jgi:hypothetical protein